MIAHTHLHKGSAMISGRKKYKIVATNTTVMSIFAMVGFRNSFQFTLGH